MKNAFKKFLLGATMFVGATFFGKDVFGQQQRTITRDDGCTATVTTTNKKPTQKQSAQMYQGQRNDKQAKLDDDAWSKMTPAQKKRSNEALRKRQSVQVVDSSGWNCPSPHIAIIPMEETPLQVIEVDTPEILETVPFVTAIPEELPAPQECIPDTVLIKEPSKFRFISDLSVSSLKMQDKFSSPTSTLSGVGANADIGWRYELTKKDAPVSLNVINTVGVGVQKLNNPPLSIDGMLVGKLNEEDHITEFNMSQSANSMWAWDVNTKLGLGVGFVKNKTTGQSIVNIIPYGTAGITNLNAKYTATARYEEEPITQQVNFGNWAPRYYAGYGVRAEVQAPTNWSIRPTLFVNYENRHMLGKDKVQQTQFLPQGAEPGTPMQQLNNPLTTNKHILSVGVGFNLFGKNGNQKVEHKSGLPAFQGQPTGSTSSTPSYWDLHAAKQDSLNNVQNADSVDNQTGSNKSVPKVEDLDGVPNVNLSGNETSFKKPVQKNENFVQRLKNATNDFVANVSQMFEKQDVGNDRYNGFDDVYAARRPSRGNMYACPSVN